MIIEYVAFIVALSLFILLANLAEKKEIARMLLYAGLALVCVGEIFFSLFLFIMGRYFFFLTELLPHAYYLLGAGFALTGIAGALVLLGRVRKLLPFPLEPNSPLHAAGLFLITQIIILLLFFAIALDPLQASSENDYSVSNTELALNLILFFVVSFLAVGYPIRRSIKESLTRLAIFRPKAKGILMAALLVLILMISDTVFSMLQGHFFPEIQQRLNEILESIAKNLGMSMVSVLLFGISAGVGEEILFRGALQPRYGIVLTSFFFAIMHVSLYGMTFAIASAFMAGIFLGILRKMTDTTTCIITHILYDIVVTVWNFYL